MEQQLVQAPFLDVVNDYIPDQPSSTSKPFIEANTVESTFEEIKNYHLIPVFLRDNEPLISHSDFIEVANEVVQDIFSSETILKPNIRLSHPVKGRTPDAKNKAANELLDNEKTLYFERMAFVIEVPSISEEIDSNRLSLMIGGVKSYAQDNLYSKNGADQHFKVFVGFKNTVCTNLCIWSDGMVGDLKVKSQDQLKACIRTLLENYNASYHIHTLIKLVNCGLTEQQFALLIGRSRMYNFLPRGLKKDIIPLLLSDTQLGAVVKDYYRDGSFCRQEDGSLNLWRLYNLFTGANKSSYIDTFLERSVNAFRFVVDLKGALDKKELNWFLT